MARMRGAEAGREEGHPTPSLARKLGAATAGMTGRNKTPTHHPALPLSLSREEAGGGAGKNAFPALLFPD